MDKYLSIFLHQMEAIVDIIYPFTINFINPNVCIYLFIISGIDPDVQLKSGWTPLLLAASLASPDIVELLTARGANVNFHKGIG